MKATILYRLILSFGLLMVMASPGIAQFDLRRDIPWRIGDVGSSKTPTKIVAVWTDAVLHQAGKPATRGFGGRLMFYGPEENTPLKVEGTLVVYAFDEEGRSPTDVKPDRKYVFPPDQFARHYSKSKLGHSYSVWIPWDEVGGPRKEISLIARFIPKNGSAIVSAPSRQILPGLPSSESAGVVASRWSASAVARQPLEGQPTPAQTVGRTQPGGPWLQESSYAQEPNGPSAYRPGHLPQTVSGPSFPPISQQPSFSEGKGFDPTANPLRRTSYDETSSAEEVEAPSQGENVPNQPRMKTATIPVPASWLRSTRASPVSSASQQGDPRREPVQHVPPTDASWTPDPRNPLPGISVPAAGNSPSVGRENQAWGTARRTNPTGSTGAAELPRNWPSQRSATRSGPLGPQAPTGPIGPQARDRAALPPLP